VSRELAVAAGRAFAADGFIDACTVVRRGSPVTDPLDGTVTYPMSPIYTGACRVQQAAAPWAGPGEVGQAGLGLSALEIQLPVVGSEGITKDDVVTITACRNDTDLVDKKFTVQGAHHASHKTTRRLPLMEILS
jgi:hypothetical protein